jgi:hypothetical protein
MKRSFIIVSLAALLLAGCRNQYGSEEETSPKEPPFAEESSLFDEKLNGNCGTTTRVYVNDMRYWTERGYTLWTAWDGEGTETFGERTVTMSKSRGYEAAGYGLVICQGVRAAGDKKEPTMLTVMINTAGQYALGKVTGGQYESLVWWTESGMLRKGYGAPNEVTVRREGEEFKLIINGEEIQSFVDDTEPRHKGGKNGYIVVLAPQDRFDQGREVDVYFTEYKQAGE